jgi:alcohol dehydrogenase
LCHGIDVKLLKRLDVMELENLLELRKFIAPEIVCGPKALQLAGHHARNFGATKALIVTDPGVQQAGWAERVEAALKTEGINYAVFNGVTPNPKDHEVMAGADFYRSQDCDLILAVGGGSPMDCAKGIGVVVGNNQNILDFEGVDEVPGPGPPLIFIPTTAGTSADVSQFAIITDSARKVKIAILSKMVMPDIAIVDPETTTTMGPGLTASTGLDALCHAIEAYVSTASSMLTDIMALEAVRLIINNLEGAYQRPDNLAFRNHMMMASLMAGLAFSSASLGLVHAMAHSLGGALELAHGECNAMLLERVVAFNYPTAADRYARIAATMNISAHEPDPGKMALPLVESLAAFRQRLGITQRLSDLGVRPSDLPMLARNAANDPCLSTNPREATPAQIEAIYREIL